MKKHVSVLIALWLLATTASFLWGTHNNTRQSRDNAVKTGRAFFKLISISREWNAMHGGVYVPTTYETKPSPYLPLTDQILSCDNGTQLTLINPAIMSADLAKIARRTEGLSFRLISTTPLNPENKPTLWEREALEQFATHTIAEKVSFSTTNQATTLNYIAPLYIGPHCLRCHTDPKYMIGDVIGGISISTPFNQRGTSTAFIFSHLGGALFGTLILLFYGIRLQQNQQLLIEAKTRAERANLAKSTFLATMSHELRTPLSGIIGMTGLITEKNLPNELKQPIDDITSSAKSLITIINNILDFSKLEVHKLTLTTAPLDLADLCQECLRLIAPLARDKNLHLHYDFDHHIPTWLEGDALRLRQIILNLLQNSIKFTPTGSVHLKVMLQTETSAKAFVKFMVIDTGIGLSLGEQKLLFKPYQQATETTTIQYGGTGLGLFICKQLTHLMNGTIRVESSKQTGSTFFFTAEFSKTLPPPETVNETIQPILSQHKTILIADDSTINRKVLQKILSDYGYKCTCVDNGQEALDLATMHRYDVIILDSRIPKLDGPATCTEIRKTLYGASTPILALTADITEQEHSLCFDAGMDDVIIKPVDPAALLMTIDQLIAKAQQNQQVSPSKT